MVTKYNIDDEVYVRAKIVGISITDDGITYRLNMENYDGKTKLEFNQSEEQLVSADVVDFRNENPTPAKIISDYMMANPYAKVVVADQKEPLDVEALKDFERNC